MAQLPGLAGRTGLPRSPSPLGTVLGRYWHMECPGSRLTPAVSPATDCWLQIFKRKQLLGPALWHPGLRHHLGLRSPISEGQLERWLLHVRPGSLLTHLRQRGRSDELPGSWLPGPLCSVRLGRDTVGGRPLANTISLSVTLPFKYVNKYILKMGGRTAGVALQVSPSCERS